MGEDQKPGELAGRGAGRILRRPEPDGSGWWIVRLIFAYTESVPNVRKCRVSFTDTEGVTHIVEVAASSLYEAAALALAEFRRCGFADAEAGPATRLTVAVEAPSTTHELTVRKLSAWLDGGGKSPSEQAVKVRLRELLGPA